MSHDRDEDPSFSLDSKEKEKNPHFCNLMGTMFLNLNPPLPGVYDDASIQECVEPQR